MKKKNKVFVILAVMFLFILSTSFILTTYNVYSAINNTKKMFIFRVDKIKNYQIQNITEAKNNSTV